MTGIEPDPDVGVGRDGRPSDASRAQRRRLLVAIAVSAAAIVLIVVLFAVLKPGTNTNGAGSASSAPTIAVGADAPAFTLPNLLSTAGSPLPPVALDALGKDHHRPVVLNFFASWCTPCRKETPLLAAAALAEARSGSPVQFIGVAVADNPAQAIPFVTKAGVTYPIGADVNLQVAADVYGLADEPATFFLNAEGVVVARHVGALSSAALQADLGQLSRSGHE